MRGCVDQIGATVASGWVLDPAHPAREVRVRLAFEGRVLAEGAADMPRPGVGKLFGTDGRHGFRFAGLALGPAEIERLAVEARSAPDAPWQPVPRRPALRPPARRSPDGRKVTVIGTSHVEALRYALPPGQDWIEIINIGRPRAGVPEVTPSGWRDASDDFRVRFTATLDPDRHFVCMLGGNDHNAIGLIEHPQRFDFAEPGGDTAPDTAPDTGPGPDREPIPYDVMRAVLEQRIAPYRRWMAHLAPVFAGRKLHLCSPPPIASVAHIRSFPGSFKGTLRRGVTPAPIRARLHRLNSDIYRTACAELGIAFLPPPAAARDAAGFLKQTYWNRDPTHGNSHYGRLLLQQIEEHLAS